MKVSQLINELAKLNPNAEVYCLWDGRPRTRIDVIYESVNGSVIVSDYSQPCYEDEALPKGVDVNNIELVWKTPKNPNKNDYDSTWD